MRFAPILPKDVDPSKLTDSDRRRLFGNIPTLISRLAAENSARAQAILVSLYLQLLGHNKHKYLIIYIGEGHNGKSLLLTLLREVLGELCSPLHKSILFVTKETASHSAFKSSSIPSAPALWTIWGLEIPSMSKPSR